MDRLTKEKHKGQAGVVLKDQDFQRKLYIGGERKTNLNKQIEKDCQLFESLNLMDYSLLIGIVPRVTNPVLSSSSTSASIMSSLNGSNKIADSTKVPRMLFFLDPSDQLSATSAPVFRYSPNIGAPPPARPCLRRVYKRSLTIPDGDVEIEPDSAPETSGSTTPHLSASGSAFSASSSSLTSKDSDGLAGLKKSTSKMIKSFKTEKPRRSSKGKSDMPQPSSSLSSSSSSIAAPATPPPPPVELERPAATTISHVSFEADRDEEIYYLGIIDYLQKYTRKKKLARLAKSITHDKDKLSTASPSFYSKRFRDFLSNSIE